MTALIKKARGFVADESGASLVEYALLVSLIAVVCIVAVGTLGTNIKGVFEYVAGKITAPSAPPPAG